MKGGKESVYLCGSMRRVCGDLSIRQLNLEGWKVVVFFRLYLSPKEEELDIKR